MENDSLRNRLRHSVIPELEAIAGKDVPQRSAARMSRHLREDDGFLTSMAERRVYSTHTPFGDGMRADDLADLSPVVAKRVFMLLYRNAVLTHTRGERQGSLSAAHLEELLEFTRKGIPEARLMLPEGMMALIREEYLLILPAEPPEALPPIPTEAVPLREGITDWHDRVYIMLERFPAPAAPLEGEWVLASAVFPGDIPHPLVARKRQDGDRILSHGMHKRLKKLLQEKGVPVYVRDRIPLVCLWDGSPGGEPFWYPTVAFRDGYPPPAEGPCLRITFAHRDTLRPEK